ncbi:MAG: MFS transporter [Nitrospinae bacterium]|nr:MFS transporter [Nitrospinota bacterium]
MGVQKYARVLLNRRMASMLFLGFSSGLPLALTSGTLQAWMSVAGVDVRTIGLFALVGAPYALKFLWAPAMDRFVPPFLGRRRGWMLTTQAVLMSLIAVMAGGSPAASPVLLGLVALLTSFAGASQDVVIDAYRTDVLREEERGEGVAVFVAGYRIAMLASGAFALILSDRVGWRSTYLLMAALMAVGMVAVLLSPEPDEGVAPPRTLADAAVNPLREFFGREAAPALLLLVVLFKLPDAYAGTMTTPFLIRGLGFSPSDVGVVNKGFGMASLVAGAMLGGAFMVRLGLYRSLLAFGFLQAGSNLAFSLLAAAGKNYPMMILAVGVENFCGGMGTSAFVALLMALCNHAYSATQFALLSSLASLGRVFASPTAGYVAADAGWAGFFVLATLAGLPGLFLLWRLRRVVEGLEKRVRVNR